MHFFLRAYDSRAKRSARIDAIKPIDDEDYHQVEGSGVANDDDSEYSDYEEEDVEDLWDDENVIICDNIERMKFLLFYNQVFQTSLFSMISQTEK